MSGNSARRTISAPQAFTSLNQNFSGSSRRQGEAGESMTSSFFSDPSNITATLTANLTAAAGRAHKQAMAGLSQTQAARARRAATRCGLNLGTPKGDGGRTTRHGQTPSRRRAPLQAGRTTWPIFLQSVCRFFLRTLRPLFFYQPVLADLERKVKQETQGRKKAVLGRARFALYTGLI